MTGLGLGLEVEGFGLGAARGASVRPRRGPGWSGGWDGVERSGSGAGGDQRAVGSAGLDVAGVGVADEFEAAFVDQVVVAATDEGEVA